MNQSIIYHTNWTIFHDLKANRQTGEKPCILVNGVMITTEILRYKRLTNRQEIQFNPFRKHFKCLSLSFFVFFCSKSIKREWKMHHNKKKKKTLAISDPCENVIKFYSFSLFFVCVGVCVCEWKWNKKPFNEAKTWGDESEIQNTTQYSIHAPGIKE